METEKHIAKAPETDAPGHPETAPAAGEAWYAVYTRSRFEKEVAAEFNLREINHYLPLVRREQRWKDRRKWVDFPLFPSYLFVRADFSDLEGWDRRIEILRVKGVVKLICSAAGLPLPIPDQEIFNIRTVLEKKLKVDPYQFDLKEGQSVRIRKGPLKGVEGTLIKRKKGHSLVLKVHLLQQAIVTELPAADVEAAS